MTEVVYPFSSGNRLEDRNAYFIAPYEDAAFLEAWRRERRCALAAMPAPTAPPADGNEIPSAATPENTPTLLDFVYGGLRNGREGEPEIRDWLGKLVKKFEVTKHIHSGYDGDFLALDKTSYKDLSLYVRFAEVVEEAYAQGGSLIYLNAVLKCLDTLCSLKGELFPGQQARLAWLIQREEFHVNELMKSLADR